MLPSSIEVGFRYPVPLLRFRDLVPHCPPSKYQRGHSSCLPAQGPGGELKLQPYIFYPVPATICDSLGREVDLDRWQSHIW